MKLFGLLERLTSLVLRKSGTEFDATITPSSLTVDRTIVLPDEDDTLATQTYVNDAVATKDEASEISYDNATSGLTATDVQAAVDEVEGRVDTAETNIGTNSTNHSNHLADATDAHDASAISNVASGNLAATDVQAALDELQGDIDTANTNIGTNTSDISANTSDIADLRSTQGTAEGDTDLGTFTGSTISDNGTVKDGMQELETSLETKAADADLTAHTGASSGVHGVTGDVVGTTDAQVLTGKDIDGGTASNTSRITIPKAATGTLSGLTRKEATIVYDTTLGKFLGDDGSELKDLGGGLTSDFQAVNFTAEAGNNHILTSNITAITFPGRSRWRCHPSKS